MREKIVKAIQTALQTGDRVIIVPIKDGAVRVFVIKREELK